MLASLVIRLTASVLSIAVFCGMQTAPQVQPRDRAARSWVVRLNGAGPARVGMTVSELSAVLGQEFSAPTNEEDRSCFYLEPKAQPNIGLMIIKGRLARVDVSQRNVPTSKGIRVGDSEEQVRRAYGPTVEVTSHHYTHGRYLTVRSGNYGIRFESEEGKITSFYAGSTDAISLVEGCS